MKKKKNEKIFNYFYLDLNVSKKVVAPKICDMTPILPTSISRAIHLAPVTGDYFVISKYLHIFQYLVLISFNNSFESYYFYLIFNIYNINFIVLQQLDSFIQIKHL